ncbi:MAG: Asp-tRNA(Asn)/Glu-tRNA(Gln) amidotransferase GatCAB subunit B [Crocinitomicaceae bacterium]|nr:Asp-tRNA(Asn)/Glu-tRNA(Gln) amidotransferase GatCAB subunit B [Crocinitomicaceae bacterium]|tara:strand:- start:6507 stop:7973 length:1467 start_codon:yes stop_codon:yes gene_type:complete
MKLSQALEKYEPVIGIEIHAQLKTNSKAFCSDINEYGGVPNTQISPVSLGHPGTLPRFNKKVVNYAVKMGLACNSSITTKMHFDRKNYFYADLPKGYQITQDKTPICRGGNIIIKDESGNEKPINLTRIHMEEDSGKSIHDQDPFNSLIDLNRAGVPLIEIVTEPDLKSSTEAYNYVTEVRKLLRYLEICDGNMEEGSMRCDVNISIMPIGSNTFGQRVEIKNLNSIRNVQRSIDYEICRHASLLNNGEKIAQQTRNFDASTGKTIGMRTKESAHDYRYFPEPDLTALILSKEYIEKVKKSLPPLPNELYKKYHHQLGLSDYDSTNLTENKDIALYFEKMIISTTNYKAAANWIMGSIKSYLNHTATTINQFPISAENMVSLIGMIDQGNISNSLASQQLFPEMLKTPTASPEEIAKEKGWLSKNDENELENIILTIFKENPSETTRFKNGEKKLTGFFMGKIMKASKGTADPKSSSILLNKLIKNEN